MGLFSMLAVLTGFFVAGRFMRRAHFYARRDYLVAPLLPGDITRIGSPYDRRPLPIAIGWSLLDIPPSP